MGFWTTGQWGEKPGDLFETGLHSFERLIENEIESS